MQRVITELRTDCSHAKMVLSIFICARCAAMYAVKQNANIAMAKKAMLAASRIFMCLWYTNVLTNILPKYKLIFLAAN
jgi:hypothetical protein